MPEAMIPAIDELGDRRFAFYPAILNVEHNEWVLRESKWSEILVVNCKSGDEVWIPRRFVGEVSSADDPIVIVGLRKELEYKAGSVWPHERRLLKMPGSAPHRYSSFAGGPVTAPPDSFLGRISSSPEKRVERLIAGALAVGIALILVVVLFLMRPVKYQGIEQVALSLSAEDDYNSVIRKLGQPVEDRWKSDTGEMQYRLLRFKGKSYGVVLMGTERATARYIGAMSDDWKPISSVKIGNTDTAALLRKLQKF
jgi:hypothetical protein